MKPGMFIIPHGAPEGYEWFVALVVLACLYFAVRNFMRAAALISRSRRHPGSDEQMFGAKQQVSGMGKGD
jgi:hypothetical protein